ncbi:diaminopimelate epimerase [Enterococcus haemoperoxidus ATCC BAA-382]|uniref:Diaminopimelate epimerase n=1 Tax=Enterococcus haemoperoxidus ATCC BAA-382 TaxID=1158608 RepID=R2SY31_9ENTE|nr:diaminopimelate epimerase [Enterococcus haemoperoxidus]EOI00168.1 diaminopimelate epimerase [Enterococcus haemoperoxidus ATCC BAA-382]EOT59594.1 diaminopimelate epimerase [Enterococcus haemoperoxidus ATCC BAA-382]
MNITMQKVHGSENDFFLIDETELERPFTDKEIDDLRTSLCDRKTGLLGGADGLLLVEKVLNGEAIAKMRVINSDGSEASMCGNGLRTVARYLAEKYEKESFTVETMFADLKVRQAPNLGEHVATYQVEISPVSFEADAIPMQAKNNTIIDEVIPELSSDLKFSVVAVPNPHLITFVDHQTLMGDEFERIAAYVNGENPIFTDGVNVSFVEIIGKNKIFVRTFERGVGFTNACGTAMCASSLMYVLLSGGKFNETITVRNMGGMVKTVVHEDDSDGYWMELIGNATITYLIAGSLTDFTEGNFEKSIIKETTEQADYVAFLNAIK